MLFIIMQTIQVKGMGFTVTTLKVQFLQVRENLTSQLSKDFSLSRGGECVKLEDEGWRPGEAIGGVGWVEAHVGGGDSLSLCSSSGFSSDLVNFFSGRIVILS